MYCPNCGKMLPDGAMFCPSCGRPVNVSGKVHETFEKASEAAGNFRDQARETAGNFKEQAREAAGNAGQSIDSAISEVAGTTDVSGATYVVIGKTDGDSFINGIPAIKRNAYAGGEGGAVFGTANLTLLNGYIGYEYNPALSDDPETELDDRYEEKIIDETWKDKEGNFIPNTNLLNSGNIFGGGYIDNSYVDSTCVTLYGGNVRNSVFGGGEIAAIGRGAVDEGGEHNVERTNVVIYGAGKTHIYMYGGHVMRNVFGGGKGIDNLGRTGSLYTDGYVFGQTDVNIYGGVYAVEWKNATGRVEQTLTGLKPGIYEFQMNADRKSVV